MTRIGRWVAAGAALVALTGCVRTTVDTTIGSDGTFSQHAVIAFSDEAASQLGGQLGGDLGGDLGDAPTLDPDALLDELEGSEGLAALEERYPGQIDVAPYDDGELQGVEVTVTDLPLEEFANAAEEAGGGLGASATLEEEDGRFVLVMAAPEGLDLGSLGVTPSQLSLVESSVDIGVTYTFPGLVEAATAGEIDGHTVTLGLADLASGEDIRIVAGATDSIDWGPFLLWGGVALAFVLVVGGATALVVQDRRAHRRSSLPEPHVTDAPAGPGMLSTPEHDAPGATAGGDEAPDEDPEPPRSS